MYTKLVSETVHYFDRLSMGQPRLLNVNQCVLILDSTQRLSLVARLDPKFQPSYLQTYFLQL